MIERGPKIRAVRSPDRQRLRAIHPLAELRAQTIDLKVVGTHTLPHDLRRDANHVGVADAAPLDDPNDGHPGRQFALLWLDAQDPRFSVFERAKHFGWGGGNGT